MTALYIILSVVLLLVILSICPVSVYARYTDEPVVILKYLFVKYRVLPQKEKKKNGPKHTKSHKVKKEPNEKEKKQTSFLKKVIDKKGLSGFLSIIKEIAQFSINELKDLFKHIIINDMYVNLSVCGEDAADTAVNYGKCCSVVYPAVSIIAENSNTRQYTVNVTPNFDENAQTKIDAYIKAKIKLFWLVKTSISAFFKASKLYIKIKTNL